MPEPDPLAMIHQGWEHLKAQRPLAAWARWQRAARVDPENPAARKALETLALAEELPSAARASYRFQTPSDERRRARWDGRLRGEGLDDLANAANAFASLAQDDPADDLARLNLALCQAWLGQNVAALATLEDVVRLLATSDPTRAAEAWTLAEVLRRGAEAEPFADDLRHVWTVEHDLAEILVDGVLRRWPNLRPIETPRDPIAGGPVLDDVTVFEWLDRPLPHAESSPNRFSQVLATLFRTPGRLKLSSPDPSAFARLDEPPFREAAILLREARREATPLPLAWSDAALGAFRFPKGLDDASQRVLTRDAIERYFEHLWIHQPRRALDGLTPLEASRGDTEARAKLAGVLRFREQLGTRSTHAPLYQGYPFDRLRRRLGLIRAEESGVVDPDDLSCMSGEELDALDFAKSTPPRQAEALASAASLRDDDRTARFLTAWLKADPSRFGALDLELMVAPLIRRALEHDDVSEAIAVLRKVADLASDPSSRRVAETWAGEILARFGQPFEAIEHFMAVVAELPPEEAATAALDAAETLLDNGLEFKAEGMLKEALLRATELGMDLIAAEAREHLARLG